MAWKKKPLGVYGINLYSIKFESNSTFDDLNKLIVGVDKHNGINSVSLERISPYDGVSSKQTYYLKDNEPLSSSYSAPGTRTSTRGWSKNRAPMTVETASLFDSLKDQVPEIKDDLESAIGLLQEPGSEYTKYHF